MDVKIRGFEFLRHVVSTSVLGGKLCHHLYVRILREEDEKYSVNKLVTRTSTKIHDVTSHDTVTFVLYICFIV